MYLQSSGFCGYDVWLNKNQEVDFYTYWSRFTVKQTYDKLQPKRTFTPHISNYHSSAYDWNTQTAIHGPQSGRHGWEWYEMGFFACWSQLGSITLLCFDLPAKTQLEIQSTICPQDVSGICPYAMFSLVSDALLRLYDDSVWAVRNHISQWEARRSQETDYFLLHEVARHGVHVSETLNAAMRSLDAMQHHRERFHTANHFVRDSNGYKHWDKVRSRFEFQLRFLEGLLQRSEANNARIQNEITLTIFGTNFFSFEPDRGTGKSSFAVFHLFWIYWALSIPLTVVTLAWWFWWTSRVLLPERFSHRLQPLLAITCYHPPTRSASLSISTSHLKRYLLTVMANNHQFTIGWICPLPLEKEAARLVLDEEYPQDEVQHQNAFYLGGRIGNHKIVIGVQRRIGLTGAAILAEKIRAGFPNIKYFLLVGIAGGVPRYGPAGTVSDIVLGDVVVSSPRGNHGGVVQYDKGAWEGQGRLNFRGHTSGVPGDLIAAVNNFRAEGSSKTNIAEVLKQMRLKLDDERQHQYDDPGPGRDRLYQDTYEHQGTELDDCRDCCDADHVDSRSDRGGGAIRLVDKPSVHFGNIASSNQLQISAVQRNRVQQEHDVICFEMEAAGVMDEYPCVVVRGICDYADSHKNKGWQNYAAATAVAYAKGLLDMIPVIDAKSSAQSAEQSSPQQHANVTNMTFGNNTYGIQSRDIHGNVQVGRH
ncbi:hypothetical protein PTNB73_02417 [Pyrenophora teres f. teres]|nr:hypothetical protein PTNB73_02417 [Pyrenophora teres f. teres]